MNTGAAFFTDSLRTIALIGKYNSREISDSLCLLASKLQQRGIVVLIEKRTAENSEC